MGNCLRSSLQNSPSSSSSWDEWECVVDSTSGVKYQTVLRSSTKEDDDDYDYDDEVDNGLGFMSTDKEKKRLLASSSSSSSCSREVKIKITKKELEELVSGLNMQGTTGLSLQQLLLARLMINGDDDDDRHRYSYNHLHHHQPWKPALQSIPEVN